jgi:hypothetical protein
MKKVLMMLLIIGLASTGVGLGTALGAPVVLTSIKLGDGTAGGYGTIESPAGTFTVSGTGTDTWTAGDSFQYAYMMVSGDFDFIARTTSVIGNAADGGWTKAGIMCRANITDTPTGAISPFAFMATTTGAATAPNGLTWQCRRSMTVADCFSQSGVAYTLPVYLRVTRKGNVFNGLYSQDGETWTAMGGTGLEKDLNIAMTDPVYIGLAVASHNAPSLSTAVFDQVNLFWGATNPTPALAAREYDYPAPIQLKWDALANPDGAIKDWTVYFGSSPDDPNAPKLGTVNEPTREITSPALESDKTYYWRVDATNVANGDVSRGFWWSFSTKSAKPYIDPLANVSAAVNCLVTLNATAKSGAYADQGDMTFVWKKSDGTVLKVDGPGAALTSSYSQAVSIKNDPNTFFVEVTNKNGTTKSNEVRISIASGTPSFSFTHLMNAANGGVIAAGTGGSRSGNTYTLIGSGDDIWNNADSCEFAYIPASGDGVLTVRVASAVGNPNDGGWTKAGIMMRGSLSSDAVNVAMLATTGTTTNNRSTFQWRPVANAASSSSYVDGLAVPKWERLVRAGDTFTAFYSMDGVNWTQQGTAQTFTMPKDMFIGLAITAHSATSLSTATFDNITASFASVRNWQPLSPVVSPLDSKGWVDPTKVSTLNWTKAEAAPCGSSYKVYYGDTPTTVTTLLGATGVDVFKFDIPANTFPFNATIYWRVDTVLGSETVAGLVWSFNTVQQVPLIITHPVVQTVVKAGMPANLNVVGFSATTPAFIPLDKFEWFQVRLGVTTKVSEGVPAPKWTTPDLSDPLWGQYNCPLALTDIQVAKEGEYYCVITNKIGTATSNKGLVITNRMMLHYTFEEVVNNVIKDQSPSGFDATLFTPTVGGKPAYSLVDEGIGLGKAIKLTGPNDPNGAYITTNKKPLELGINAGLPRSVSVWAKAQAFNNAGLFDMGAYTTGQNFCLRTLSGFNNRWRVQYYAMDRDTDVTPSFNAWVHFVLVFDGVNSQLYVNGQLAKDVNGAYINYASPLATDNTNNVVIGRYQSDVNRYIGLIDDFRLYNYALTAQEAAQLYVAVKGGMVCPAPLRYDLDGDCQVDLRDFAIFAAQWAQTGIAKP